jgi:GTPase
MLVVSANTGVAGTTLDHLNLALALGVPFFIVVTKIDVAAKNVVERTLDQLLSVLSLNAKRRPFVVNDVDLALSPEARKIKAEPGGCVPIFLASSVTGKGLDILKAFLHVLPPYLNSAERETLEKVPAESVSMP